MKRIEEPELNRTIIILFLDKIELLTKEEREEMLKVIRFLNNPMWVTETTKLNK